MTNRLTSRSALLLAAAVTLIEVDVPEIGTIRIKQLSVAEFDDVRTRVKPGAPSTEFGITLTAYALVDDAGAPLFDINDLQPLRASAGTKIDAIVAAVLEANGFKRASAPQGAEDPKSSS